MTGRRALVGLSLLCALAFTAFSAASASAATSGTTPVTCVDTAPTNNGDYTDAHCDTTGPAGASKYKHVAIGAETTSVVDTNSATASSTTAPTTAFLEATVGGVGVKIHATTVNGTGTLKKQVAGEVHETLGSGIVITYTGVVVTSPANCTVMSPLDPVGTVITNTLKSFTVPGTPMQVKFEPVAQPFTTLKFTGELCILKNVEAAVIGSVLAEPSGQHAAVGGVQSAGATLNVNVTKASAQLKVGGQNASLTGLETIKMKEGNPIASTEPIA
jgi:hypothetical protein